MGQTHLIKSQLRYLLFSEIYLRYSEPKTKRKAFSLLEVAIQCFDKKGFAETTLKMIAREAAVTPPLLTHYFEDLDEIRMMALKYIRVVAQKIVVDAIGETQRPDEMLERYLEAHSIWARGYKLHARVWLGFLQSSSKREADRTMNTVAVETGRKRIAEMLAAGRKAGYFTHQDDDLTATLIQTMMLGWFVSAISENVPNPDALSRAVLDRCRGFVGLPPK